jgi:uncharacterized protein YoxC
MGTLAAGDKMSRELDEISRAIGRMESAMEHANQSRDQLTGKMDELAKAMNAFGNHVSKIADDVAEMKPLVEDYRDTRARAKGVVAVVTLGAALVGGVAGKVIEIAGMVKG